MLSIVLGIVMILWSSLAYGQLIKEKLNFNRSEERRVG